jgi:hypothetical protein
MAERRHDLEAAAAEAALGIDRQELPFSNCVGSTRLSLKCRSMSASSASPIDAGEIGMGGVMPAPCP